MIPYDPIDRILWDPIGFFRERRKQVEIQIERAENDIAMKLAVMHEEVECSRCLLVMTGWDVDTHKCFQ